MLLAFDDYGPGPVVVLLHGFPLNRSMWSSLEASVGSVYRIIAPDLRGHGDSAAPEGVYTIDEMADDVMDLLDSLQIREPVVLGGLSMGGYVALSLVERYPERFRALMLMDTRSSADTPDAARSRQELAERIEAWGDIAVVAETMLPRLFSDVTRSRSPDRIGTVRAMMDGVPARALIGALRGMAIRPDRTALLPNIRIPTLVLVGADDQITPPAEAPAMADAIPGARLAVIPDAGHLAPLENPSAVTAAVLEFLSTLS